ncbi:MAG: thioredoxin domain-containing protein [Candidatus Bathyarchaeota archaeon]|nr:thioredoxin domain-containing protein [Candidatus Bathyarchaeota archaeon]
MTDILDVNATNWDKEVLQSLVLTAVDFWEKGCYWCLKFDTIFKEVAEEYNEKLKFKKLNVRESIDNHAIAVRYGVVGKPALLFFYKGKVLGEVIGIKTKGRLRKTINDILDKNKELLK